MSQVLCWNYPLTASKFNESIVNCDTKEILLDYLTSTSIIIFTENTIKDKNNLLLLTLIQVSCPRTTLVCIGGCLETKFFKNIKECELDEFISNSVVRPFQIEDKIATIREAFSILS